MPVPIIFWLVIALFSLLEASDPATRLTYITEEYPPANFIKDHKPSGYAVEILQATWMEMGIPEQPIRVLPWAQGYQEALKTPGTVLFAMARSPQREDHFLWVGPISMIRYVLVANKNREIVLHCTDDAHQYITGVVQQDISESLMHMAGFDSTEIVACDRWTSAFEKMRKGKVQLICIAANSIEKVAKASGMDPGSLEIVGELAEIGDYYAFHRGTDSILVQRFQNAFNAIPEKRREILIKYGQSYPEPW